MKSLSLTSRPERRRLMLGLAGALFAAGPAMADDHGVIEQRASEPGAIESGVSPAGDLSFHKRVFLFNGVEDEIVFDDVEIGGRVRVLEFTGENGERHVIRVHGDAPGDSAGIDGAMLAAGADMTLAGSCVAGEGEGEPVMLEFRDESGGRDTSVHHTIICLTGEEARPENRAEALDRAIDQLERDARRDAARRKKMIKTLRAQAKELSAN